MYCFHLIQFQSVCIDNIFLYSYLSLVPTYYSDFIVEYQTINIFTHNIQNFIIISYLINKYKIQDFHISKLEYNLFNINHNCFLQRIPHHINYIFRTRHKYSQFQLICLQHSIYFLSTNEFVVFTIINYLFIITFMNNVNI